ncbi:hypothetical protein DSECCO2_604680 [anaerobic digester metagenome]
MLSRSSIGKPFPISTRVREPSGAPPKRRSSSDHPKEPLPAGAAESFLAKRASCRLRSRSITVTLPPSRVNRYLQLFIDEPRSFSMSIVLTRLLPCIELRRITMPSPR